jgi:uncharacterized protein YbjT (DUF2867 family)
MRVLVTGANGFIGSHVVAALRAAGHRVVHGVRRNGSNEEREVVICDFTSDLRPEHWLAKLDGIDAVINCAGILREHGRETFERVHRAAPAALFQACAQRGLRRVIQISALGEPQDAEFVRSKHDGDNFLATLNLDWTILRPSVVYSSAGSYGGTSLLRAMAAMPFVIAVSGNGQQRLQPIAAEDLARAIVHVLETGSGKREILQAVGPQIVTIEAYLHALRRWLGYRRAPAVRVPLWLAMPIVWLADKFGRGPLGATMFRMLARGNIGAADAAEHFARAIGFHPRSLTDTLAATPSHVQDRWHARLYFLRPLLRCSLGLLWFVSGVVGFVTPFTVGRDVLAQMGVGDALAAVLIYGTSAADVAVGGALMAGYVTRLVGLLTLVLLIGFTVFLGVAAPALWLEPFGALIKNIPLIPAVLVMLVLEDSR